MKSIIKYTCGLLLMGAVASCSPEEYDTVNPELIPLVSNNKITVKVDETNPVQNIAVFQTEDIKGQYPVWYVDGKVFSHLNPATYTSVEAGDHVVELRIANRNGLSDGAQRATFSFSETKANYDELFDQLCNENGWKILYTEEGHLGCGGSGTDGSEYWSAKSKEKEEFGIYNDVIKFAHGSEDAVTGGTFSYDPGEDGNVYVNHGVTDSKFAEYTAVGHAKDPQEDVVVPVEAMESTFSIEKDGDDLFLVLAPQTLMPYIPNDDMLANPKYKIAEISKSKLTLIIDNGGIAWRMVLTSKEIKEGATIELNGEAVTKVLAAAPNGWWINGSVAGHIGCGESTANPGGWWSAPINDKADFGLYESVLTFDAEGKYTITPSAKGIYVNKGCKAAPFAAATSDGSVSDDVNVEIEKQESTFQVTGKDDECVLTLGENTFFPYVPFDGSYENPTFQVAEIASNKIVLLAVGDGIVWTFTLTNGEADAIEIKEAADVKKVLAAASNGWHIDGSLAGHIGCGESTANPGGWWSAPVNDKADFGLYESVVTFDAEGKYTITPSAKGIYVNKGCKAAPFAAATSDGSVSEDVNVEIEKQESTFDVTGKEDEFVLTLGENTFFPYEAFDGNYTNPTFQIAEIAQNKIVLLAVGDGIVWTYTLTPVK